MKKLLYVLMLSAIAAVAGEYGVNLFTLPMADTGWKVDNPKNPACIWSDKNGSKLEFTITANAEEEMNVWVYTQTRDKLGRNGRSTTILVNGEKVGIAGDDACTDAQFKGGCYHYWKKLSVKAKFLAGENKITLVSRPFTRINGIFFTTDDTVDPLKPREVPALTGDAFELEQKIANLTDIGGYVKDGNGGAFRAGSNGASLSFTFEAPAECNASVWAFVFTCGEGWRKHEFQLNGKILGMAGDGKRAPGEKSYHWEKVSVGRINQGINTIKVTGKAANSSRIVSVVISSDPEFDPRE